MAPLSSLAADCCPKWKKVPAENQLNVVWVNAHLLHHNLLRHRPPFTVDRLAELAECSISEAQAVLDEAVRLEWFNLQAAVPERPARDGQLMGQPARPAYYLSPVKTK